MSRKNKILKINARLKKDGLTILVDGRPFNITWPRKIWQKTPQSVKEALRHNLAYATTNFLPLILDKDKISYRTSLPLLETYIFKNQLYDVMDSEWQDDKKPLSYLKPFYNLEIEFNKFETVIPQVKPKKPAAGKKPIAIIPFTFGKESLTTFALCRELGIEPILIYCQEPAHPHEEKLKRKMLARLAKEYGVKTHFIKNETGLFRYGLAFNKKNGTEIGWAAQTTILALMAVPFTLAYGAEYIFFGSENSNNAHELVDGWKVFCSYDQTSGWTPQQSNMIRLLTGGQTRVYSILEPLEEINILYLLINRYPELAGRLFSCGSKKPLWGNTQWCHACDKCERIYAFAAGLGFDPKILGFKKEMARQKNFLKSHLKGRGDIDLDLEFALMLLAKDQCQTACVRKFNQAKIKKFQTFDRHLKHFTGLMPYKNLPPAYEKKLIGIYASELNGLKKIFKARS